MTESQNISQLRGLIKKNRKAIIIGLLISLIGTLALFSGRFWISFFVDGRFNPIIFATNFIGFLVAWLISSFLVARVSAYIVLGVFSLLLIVFVNQEYLALPINNLISIPSLILFWFGLSYVLLPKLIKKYVYIIASIYGVVILYFYVFRTANTFEEVHLPLIGYFITISASCTVILWIYQQLEWLISLQLNQTNTELALLKSQINPHFFFNTLNNLYGLVVEKSDQAPEVVLKLSDMMRYTIYEGKKDLVKLADEIAYLKAYIDLHKIRYQKKVDIHFDAKANGEIKVAPLLFIILLENAFKHGVENLTENAFVQLTLRTDGHQIQFEIKNNYDASNINDKPGIGLENLKKRLAYIYQHQYQLKIEQTGEIFKVKLNIQTH
ncbi:MAG: histidine kinase [Bacteroidota bacterium]